MNNTTEKNTERPLCGLLDLVDGGITPNDSYKYTYEEYVIRENMLWNYKVWEQLGFLQGLEGELKDRCAFAYEQMANYITQTDFGENVNKRWQDTYEVIIFPVIRKILSILAGENKEALFTFEKFRACEENFGKEPFSIVYPISEIEDAYPFGSYGVDIESELCKLISDTFANAIIEGNLNDVNYLEKQSYIDLIKDIDVIDKRAKNAIHEITNEVRHS